MKKTFASLVLAVPEARIGSKFPPWLFRAPNKPIGVVGNSNHGSIVMRVECRIGETNSGT